MKRVLLFFVMSLLLFSLAACGQQAEVPMATLRPSPTLPPVPDLMAQIATSSSNTVLADPIPRQIYAITSTTASPDLPSPEATEDSNDSSSSSTRKPSSTKKPSSTRKPSNTNSSDIPSDDANIDIPEENSGSSSTDTDTETEVDIPLEEDLSIEEDTVDVDVSDSSVDVVE